MNGIFRLAIAILALAIIDRSGAINHVPFNEWKDYKDLYGKVYPNNTTAEALAQYYYAYNKRLVENHNALYERDQRTFKLKVNQFSDMRLIHFNALFPVTTPLATPNASPAPDTNPATSTYDPAKNFGYMFKIEDQGTKCNSGWAYAAAKAVEILQAQQGSIVNPESLSAQNLIDCAGGANACKNQVPQTAYDYLTVYGMDLLVESEYNNNVTEAQPGMCVPRGTMPTNLAQYSNITNGDDDALMRYVSAGFPVVVEFNPASFEFMHYSEGVYQPPRIRYTGSHFMVVIGYDTDEAGRDYWILQNSFDESWGELGLMRLERSSTMRLANNAIFPSQLG